MLDRLFKPLVSEVVSKKKWPVALTGFLGMASDNLQVEIEFCCCYWSGTATYGLKNSWQHTTVYTMSTVKKKHFPSEISTLSDGKGNSFYAWTEFIPAGRFQEGGGSGGIPLADYYLVPCFSVSVQFDQGLCNSLVPTSCQMKPELS